MADETELTDAEYLRDLAERLRHIPVAHGTDGYDVDRLGWIAEKLAVPTEGDDVETLLAAEGYEVTRLDRTRSHDGNVWECKIGISPGTTFSMQGGADAPMRQAVEAAFRRVVGLEAEFCFSGWGAELTVAEKVVLDG